MGTVLMNQRNPLNRATWLAGGVCLLAGCAFPSGPSTRSSGATPPLVAADARTVRGEGSFPDRTLVAQAEAGVRAADLLRWFGPPDAGDERSAADAGEWKYIFHFRSGGGVTTCRYKVSFDSARVARSVHWQPSACGDWLAVKAPVQAQGKAAP